MIYEDELLIVFTMQYNFIYVINRKRGIKIMMVMIMMKWGRRRKTRRRNISGMIEEVLYTTIP